MPTRYLDHMLDPCALYEPTRDQSGTIVDFTRVFINAAGREHLRALGIPLETTTFQHAAPGVLESGLFARYVDVVETGKPWRGTDQTYSDGRLEVAFDVQAWAVEGCLALTWHDVSHWTERTRELTDDRQRFRSTIEQLPDAVSVLEAVREDGRIVDFRFGYANQESALAIGVHESALPGRLLLEAAPDEADLFEVCVQVVETGLGWQAHTLWRGLSDGSKGSGAPRALDVRISKVGDGCVVVSRDVTAMRTMTAELRESYLALSSANQELRSLVPLLGRLFTEPTMATRGFIQLASELCHEDHQHGAADLLGRADSACERLEGLIHCFRQLTGTDRHADEPVPSNEELRAMLLAAVGEKDAAGIAPAGTPVVHEVHHWSLPPTTVDGPTPRVPRQDDRAHERAQEDRSAIAATSLQRPAS